MPVFFPNSCFVFTMVHTNLKKFGIKTDFQFYAALFKKHIDICGDFNSKCILELKCPGKK